MAAHKEKQAAALKLMGQEEEDSSAATGANGTSVHAAFGVSNMEDIAELEKKKLDRVLEKVKVSKEDVKLIADEMEIDLRTAERALKQHNGDVSVTLKSLIQGS